MAPVPEPRVEEPTATRLSQVETRQSSAEDDVYEEIARESSRAIPCDCFLQPFSELRSFQWRLHMDDRRRGVETVDVIFQAKDLLPVCATRGKDSVSANRPADVVCERESQLGSRDKVVSLIRDNGNILLRRKEFMQAAFDSTRTGVVGSPVHRQCGTQVPEKTRSEDLRADPS